ncbi:hypothetical protein SAY86_020547 [Trapa natans]|uniref:Uncharacterized protein n=1 Tax=Trapa natans TaxID=22666 RepID=A0AAN7R7U2_TRANT|nr:hypothetical protein SAY86_020547 [Trapa natans]
MFQTVLIYTGATATSNSLYPPDTNQQRKQEDQSPCKFDSGLQLAAWLAWQRTIWEGRGREGRGGKKAGRIHHSHLRLTIGHDGTTPAAGPGRTGRTTGTRFTTENASLRRAARLLNRDTFCRVTIDAGRQNKRYYESSPGEQVLLHLHLELHINIRWKKKKKNG